MRGLITCLKSGDYVVRDLENKKMMLAKASGLFRHNGEKPKVGDYVEYQLMNDTTAYITKIDKRFNDLERPAICNINQAFVVFSVKDPDFNTNLLDRFLTIFSYNNIKVILIFTKWDLLNESQKENLNKYQKYYEELGYLVLDVTQNADNSKAIQVILDSLKDKISVVTGQSGVGKSTLLNFLDYSLNLDVSEISYALGRGKHTTRHVELFPLHEGLIADTPGFGIMEFSGMEEIDIAQNFKDFFKLSSSCKYNGCLHKNEPCCAVKKAIKEGKILPSRYDNYLQFLEESKKIRKW